MTMKYKGIGDSNCDMWPQQVLGQRPFRGHLPFGLGFKEMVTVSTYCDVHVFPFDLAPLVLE